MNILQRLLRLTVVSKGNPVLNLITVTTLTLIFRNKPRIPALPQSTDSIQQFEPLGIINYFVNNFARLEPHDKWQKIEWLCDQGLSVIQFFINSVIKNKPNDRAVNTMPHIIAGRIESNLLINNMTGKTFIIGLSEKLIQHIGFILFLLKNVLQVFITFYIIRYIFNNYIQKKLEENKIIDIKAKPVKTRRKKIQTKDKNLLKKYMQ